MPGFTTQAQQRFNHPVLAQPEFSSNPWEHTNYNANLQLMPVTNMSKRPEYIFTLF
jgi:hypothetical protein